MSVTSYIHDNLPRSFYRDQNGSGFLGIDLPFPYTSPCIKNEGHFSFFFYWDTYFTNLGLLRSGHRDMAANNIKNIIWLIQRHGFMPNHVGIENRSQPPFLGPMVADYFHATGGPASDPDFFQLCCQTLRQEYHFWTTARHTPTGLQHHGHQETDEGCIRFYDQAVAPRLGLSQDAPDPDKILLGQHHLAEAETGWDFTPRFAGRCLDFNLPDLNGLLYQYETFLAQASPTLDWGEEALWTQRAATRRERVNRFLWDEQTGWFRDFNFITRTHSPLLSLAGLLPLFTGLASPDQAARVAAKLPALEREHGLAVTAEIPGCRAYQWAFPNAWPPLTWITIAALNRYGFHHHARRLAQTFLRTTDRLFSETGQLWEKTDAETGQIAGSEYHAAPMLGWTAGVYLACSHLLDSAP